MVELDLQGDYVLDFFCKEEGLGYNKVENNAVSNDLFIPSDLREFVSSASPVAWRNLLDRYNGNEKRLTTELMEALKERIKQFKNVAIFFNHTKTFTFHGEQLQIVYMSGTELSGDVQFEKNIFSCVEEVSYTYKLESGEHIYTIRPDLSFFLNGIYFGYAELKSNFSGQNARQNGRGKIIGDYLRAVKEYSRLANRNDVKQTLRREMLRIFESAVHLTSTDVQHTYVLRNTPQFFDELKRGFADETITISSFTPNLEKVFKPYPEENPDANARERWEQTMRNLYGKKMIEKEILYYNFVKYNFEKKNGKKTMTSNTGQLIAPRPKQKFGCDKIVKRIETFLEHEKEPNYFINKLKEELQRLGASPQMIERIVRQRELYCNNKYVYSLLLQYAAGFGKSNIIGWTALQLRDMRNNDEWTYDKILLVVDRLQLRDQLDTTMHSMNIDKAMFVEATDQNTFINALKGNVRIIVVNIQKFLDLADAIKKANEQLDNMRVAFLIDEIHRSNTGESHENMVSIFDELEDVFDQDNGALVAGAKKKNLIIGFTATPSEKVLARFGEFYRGGNLNQLWTPFDCYTMREAIADGYILDPTKHIIPVPTPMHFEYPEDLLQRMMLPQVGDGYVVRVKEIYENKERILAIARFIVDRLVNLVYTKIRGTGKAMLAVSSIPSAIEYCRVIRREMAKKCQEAQYQKYADAPIAIVYSDNQRYERASSLNENKKEEKVIENFKQAKNGLIIVVDKLQTGFDEPKLHTLFLDKEIHDINAVQTISRVNRTCKYKDECHIIDFSFNSVNVQNIREAFNRYCDMNVSNFEPMAELAVMSGLYDELTIQALYVRWFADYMVQKNSTTFCLMMEDAFRQWIEAELQNNPTTIEGNQPEGVDAATALLQRIYRYFCELELLRGVIDFDTKYSNKDFIDFWERYRKIYREVANENRGLIPVGVTFDGIIGLVGEPEVPDEPEEPRDGGGNGRGRGNRAPVNIIELIDALNTEEDAKEQQINLWLQKFETFFVFLASDSRFLAMVKTPGFSHDTINSTYEKLLRRFQRTSHDAQLYKVINENKELMLKTFMDREGTRQARQAEMLQPIEFIMERAAEDTGE